MHSFLSSVYARQMHGLPLLSMLRGVGGKIGGKADLHDNVQVVVEAQDAGCALAGLFAAL